MRRCLWLVLWILTSTTALAQPTPVRAAFDRHQHLLSCSGADCHDTGFAFVRAVACDLKADLSLFRKDGGTRCEAPNGLSYDCDKIISRAPPFEMFDILVSHGIPAQRPGWAHVANAKASEIISIADMPCDAAPPPPPPPGQEICGDGIDNDKDGQVDEGCSAPPPPPPVDLIPVIQKLDALAIEVNMIRGLVEQHGQRLAALESSLTDTKGLLGLNQERVELLWGDVLIVKQQLANPPAYKGSLLGLPITLRPEPRP